jgi:transcriptional regulator PpsR
MAPTRSIPAKGAAVVESNILQPDVTLLLDNAGVIRKVTLSNTLATEGATEWIGRKWLDTVRNVDGEAERRLIEDAISHRVSVFRQLTQRFPSGLELAMEYTTVRLGGRAGVIAIGRSLQAVAELQARLVAAQQAMERDYWKLREIETRYRLLFNASNDAVLLIRAGDLCIVEANPAAIAALGLPPQRPGTVAGRPFLVEVAPDDRESFQTTLLRAREHGTAPGLIVRLGREQGSWLLRVSLMKSQPEAVFLLQLSPAGGLQLRSERDDAVRVEELIACAPDGFVVLDKDGIVRRANAAFVAMVEVGSEAAVIGESLGRWLGRPGADLTVLLAAIRRHGSVKLFATTLRGDLGTDTEVEISAGSSSRTEPHCIGVLLRDVGRRLPARGSDIGLGSLAANVGKTSLPNLVKDAVGLVERYYLDAALKLTAGNRTAAAELLGLSRQSLYAKLSRYGLDRESGVAADHVA